MRHARQVRHRIVLLIQRSHRRVVEPARWHAQHQRRRPRRGCRAHAVEQRLNAVVRAERGAVDRPHAVIALGQQMVCRAAAVVDGQHELAGGARAQQVQPVVEVAGPQQLWRHVNRWGRV